ncbi:Major pollen allergen Bet v 1-G [Ananas comosus]|uniref:Major pollen allergen Bet v 1-G n=1 Tax=Ananas comosus TaxID=4615 RepID=A0A199VIG7_ANACO|nr:Major pollen allergen Bet v 1-G [Ananas comosus]
MVSGCITKEDTFSVGVKSLWKVSAAKDHVYLPKIAPTHIASVDVEGSGGAGTIKKINFTSAVPGVTFFKSRVLVLDEANHVFKFEAIEGGKIGERFKSQVFAYKFEAAGENSCVVKLKVEYDTIGDKPLDARRRSSSWRRASRFSRKQKSTCLPTLELLPKSVSLLISLQKIYMHEVSMQKKLSGLLCVYLLRDILSALCVIGTIKR